MGRPRIVTLPSGAEVIIKNATKEEGERLKDLILGVSSPAIESKPAEQASATPPALTPTAPRSAVDSSTLDKVAVGPYLDVASKQYKVAVVKYNSVTGEARLESSQVAGSTRGAGIELFKRLAVRHKLV